MRTAAFVVLAATIVIIGSERMFWYWEPELVNQLVIILFYTLPVGVTLWAVRHFAVDSWWPLALATPLFAYLTEGVITPMLYSGGPFVPFFPAWFGFWHGLMSFGLLLIGLRRWLLARRRWLIAGVSTALGLFWGAWSTTLRLPENVGDRELAADLGRPLRVLSPAAFSWYVLTFTAILAIAHLLIGYVWPDAQPPTLDRSGSDPIGQRARWTRRIVGALVIAVVTGWTIVIPWALPMFAVYVGIQWWGLRRHRATGPRSNLLDQLVGHVRLRDVVPILLMAPAASGVYALLWTVDPPDALVRDVLLNATIAVQTIAGAAVTVVALRRAGRAITPSGERCRTGSVLPVPL